MTILKEYLESGDIDEAAACVAELQLPQYDYYIVKRAVMLGLERKDREREAISELLSSLYGQYLSPQMMQKVRSTLECILLHVLIVDVSCVVFSCMWIMDSWLPLLFKVWGIRLCATHMIQRKLVVSNSAATVSLVSHGAVRVAAEALHTSVGDAA
jgi:hypothetical protein